MAKKGFLKNDNEIMLPITRGELVLDSSGQQAFHSVQFLANENRHGLMSKDDKINIKNIIEKTNDLDTNALNSAINSIKNEYLKSVKVDNNKLTITDQLNTETDFYNTIYTFESGTDGSFTVTKNGANPQTITVGGTLTDEKVIQKNTTDNKEYRILLSNSNNDNNEVAPSNKSGKLLFNPNTGTLTAPAFNGTLNGLLNIYNTFKFGISGLQYFQLYDQPGTAVDKNQTPLDGWWHIIRMNYNNDGYMTELASPFNGDARQLYWRTIYNKTNYGWHSILDQRGGNLTGSIICTSENYNVTPIIRNIKFTETTGWARKILAMQVDGVEQFSLGAYGYYNFSLNSENPNKADYLYLGFGEYNGNNLKIYPNGITFGDKIIWHSGNCNFLSSTNKNLTPAGSEITNTNIGELIGYQAINKSTWVYANNGYIKTEWGNMELAGSSILSFGTSGAYTQLFISAPSSSRGEGLINEMMFYNNHGSTYSPGWTRVITNRNYSNILNNTYLPLAGGKMTGPIVFNGTDTDRIIMRINNTSGESTKTSDYGFTFKYLGSGTGDNNSLALFSDNQTNTSQNKSFEIKQSGNIYTRSILPLITDGTLGTSTNRWNYIYVNYGNFTAPDVPLYITRTTNYPLISFSGGNSTSTTCYGYLGFGGSNNPVFVKSDGSTVYKLWHAGNDGTGSGLDADLLDGTHKSGLLTALTSSIDTNLSITVGGTTKSVTSLYSTYTKRFRQITNVQDFDLNTGLVGGALISNYTRYSYNQWKNAPSDMQYGTVVEFSNGGYTSLSGQLAWDINHNSTTNTTKDLYWRAADTNGFGYSLWSKIITDQNFESFVSSKYLPLSGGTMTGSIITPANDSEGIWPATNNYGQIGSSDKKFFRMYATTFYGNLQGTVKGSYIELSSSTPYIDFHYNSSSSDYTSRIIQKDNVALSVEGLPLRNSSAYTFQTITATSTSPAIQSPTFTADCSSVKFYTFLTIDVQMTSSFTGTYGGDINLLLNNLVIGAAYILRLRVRLYNSSKNYWNSSSSKTLKIYNNKGSSNYFTCNIPASQFDSNNCITMWYRGWIVPTSTGIASLGTFNS